MVANVKIWKLEWYVMNERYEKQYEQLSFVFFVSN